MSASGATRKQYAALPYKIRGEQVEVLLVTSRETRRWVLPKGWPMKDRSAWSTARQEALEEAGVRGRIHKTAVGAYRYLKRGPEGRLWDCKVVVFPLRVEAEETEWPEVAERARQWFSRDEASEMVDEDELSGLIREFYPRVEK